MKQTNTLKRNLRLAALGLLLCTVGSSCYNDNLEDMYPGTGGNCALDSVTFRATVQPIMNQSCAFAGCHDAATAAFGIDLSAYEGVQRVAASGRLVGAITHASGVSPMPKNAEKLADCKISQIQKWVSSGAQNN